MEKKDDKNHSIPQVELSNFEFSPPGPMGWSFQEYEELLQNPNQFLQDQPNVKHLLEELADAEIIELPSNAKPLEFSSQTEDSQENELIVEVEHEVEEEQQVVEQEIEEVIEEIPLEVEETEPVVEEVVLEDTTADAEEIEEIQDDELVEDIPVTSELEEVVEKVEEEATIEKDPYDFALVITGKARKNRLNCQQTRANNVLFD